MLPPFLVRILAGLVLVALVFIDAAWHAAISGFMTGKPLGGIIICALAAFVLAALLNSLVTGKLAFAEAYQKWLAEPSTITINLVMLAALLFVVLLLRYSLVSFFELTPTVLVFVAIFICVLGLWKFKGAGQSVDQHKRDLGITIRVLSIGLLFGLYLVVAATGYAPKENAQTVERTVMGWGLAYFAALFLIGFLFGIPRVLEGEQKKPGHQQRVNTNLEQISDWLTKIIVGLGLVQLRTVPDKLLNASKWMAQSFAPAGAPPSDALISFSGAFIIFFCVMGFLAGYLCTRLFLAPAFFRADSEPEKYLVDITSFPTVPTAPVPPVPAAGIQSELEADRIRKFSQAPENRRKLEDWLAQKGRPGVRIADLINDPQNADLRKLAVGDSTLNIE